MATLFFQKLTKLAQTDPGFVQSKRSAIEWYRAAAQQIKVTDPEAVKRYFTDRPGIARIRPINNMSDRTIGRMILFGYWAKWDKKLPYWDQFPCVIPIKMIKTNGAGFLGLNLHYLPPVHRAQLMDALYTIYKDKHLDENKRLNLTYNMLNSSARFKWFRPCVKRYLFTQVRSRFNLVDPVEYDFVMMLPLARWRKASQSKVWQDSIHKVRNW